MKHSPKLPVWSPWSWLTDRLFESEEKMLARERETVECIFVVWFALLMVALICAAAGLPHIDL